MSRRGKRFLTPHRTGPAMRAGEFEIVRFRVLRHRARHRYHESTKVGLQVGQRRARGE
jgi:hypothetical protein